MTRYSPLRLVPFVLAVGLLLAEGCRCSREVPKAAPAASSTPPSAAFDSAPPASAAATPGTIVSVANMTKKAAEVYVAFGSDSVVRPVDWTFCKEPTSLTCHFPLTAEESRHLPLGGKYLNATIAFDAPVGCGATKAELNVNNPQWYDTADVSLVDGFSNFVMITASPTADAGVGTRLGPPHGKDQNVDVYGVFPLGCDICTARQNPPCGIPKGTEGCKKGTQYKPDVPCQYQGPTKGGGGRMDVMLIQPVPA